MNATPDRELVLDVASRMDSKPTFIEKDWNEDMDIGILIDQVDDLLLL